jgi:hypothetical protein
MSCVLRWVLTGTRALDGRVVRLEAIRLGGRWLTSIEALQRFAETLTPTFNEFGHAPAPRPPRKRQRASERAAKQLSKIGI